MFINYLSSGCFIGSMLFVIGLWFGVRRGYAIYRHKRSLLIFITVSTIVAPALTYLLVGVSSQSGNAELLARFGAIAGFLVSLAYTEFAMTAKEQDSEPPAPLINNIMEEPSPAKANVDSYRNLRIIIYACLCLLIFLFPPYYEKWTLDRTWVFIASNNLRPFFIFDFAFFFYELFLLLAVATGIEFWQAKSRDDSNNLANTNHFKRISQS